MSESESVRLERRGAVALLTIDRPSALNALNAAVLEQLEAHLGALAGDATLRAVVLTGAGRAFVAGADIKAMASMRAVQAEAFAALGHRVGDRLAALPVPVIAAVNGFALGGGCELAMACDILLAGPYAKFGQPEVKLGVIPGFGGTQRLARRVGLGRALELCATGRTIDVAEAVAIGLVDRAVEGDVVEAALETATQIAANGPVAVRLVKRAMHENADVGLRTALAAEKSLFALCFATEDQAEGMAAFVGKRAPEFSGR